MAKYNKQIELTVEDMDLIEEALRQSKRKLSNKALETSKSDMSSGEELEQVDHSVRQIHDLLGRLHNQKIFYRPRSAPYVSG